MVLVGLYPVGGVVLLVGFARVSNEPGVVSQRSTTPAIASVVTPCLWCV